MMEANNELMREQLLASPPQSLEDVDTWLQKYNAVIDAAQAEALRVERLRDSAPGLLAALINAIESAGFEVCGATDVRVAEHGKPAWVCEARATLSRATGA